ncbi:response regulator [Roseococcus sp. SYP-B2431]|uniref:ATP-binding protein n=1 Tax=Roseococcus sp. SYP-B2431 TaxID=2496640 RepID=UPI00103D2822|nr:ATP-binding protein [Roseococcus sp. SYP-B2431]TCH97158.1 response regulator [Roseococcus sp. SYP-B2431]
MPDRNLAGAEAVIAALPQPALLLDSAGRILVANLALRRSLEGGLLIRPGDEAARVFPAAAEVMAAALRGETPIAVPVEGGGRLRALPLGGAGAMILLEPAAGGSARLEILGRLAGGIAHDFNNLLGVILGASTALRRIAAQPEAAEELGAIEGAAQRGTALVRQLLAFARQQVMAPRIVELNESVRQLAILLPRLLGAGIVLELELEEPSRRIRVDPSQWDQVLLNLVVNARDAMKGRGRLRIATGRRLVLAGEALNPGRYAVVEVTDDGPGIAPEIVPRIFEPFFTTRLDQGGTGLGLATVQGIVGQFGGQMEVESRPSATTFRIVLPRHDGPADSEPPPPVAEKRAVEGPVLLVDDEPNLLRVARFGLQQAGFGVEVAGDAEEALGRIEVGLEPCLVATDVAMPGMDGLELARAVRARHPGLPILLLSGYSASTVDSDLAGQGMHFLAKPYTPESLLAAVRKALGTA